TPRGTAVISGRSDATINRGGVRIGTSEIYRAALALDAVVDALVVDVPAPGADGRIRLFVVLRDGVALDAALADEIRARIRRDCAAAAWRVEVGAGEAGRRGGPLRQRGGGGGAGGPAGLRGEGAGRARGWDGAEGRPCTRTRVAAPHGVESLPKELM